MTKITVERLEVEDGQYVWKPYEYTLETEGDFHIEQELLDHEICRQGRLMLQYGDIASELEAMLKRKEEELKFAYAVVASKIRADAEKEGRKITENKVAEETSQDESYRQVLFTVHKCRADALKADKWWKTMVKKADLLNALAWRQGQEIRKAY